MASTTEPWILPSCVLAALPMTRSFAAKALPSVARLALDVAVAIPSPIHDRAVVEDGVDSVRRLRLEGMARAFRHVHFNSEPRLGRNLPKALDHHDRSVDDVKIPGDRADHFF